MATFSITQDVYIKEEKTSTEIKKALTDNKTSFSDIKASSLNDNSQKVAEAWFKP